MEKKRFYYLIILLLIATNVVLLAMLLRTNTFTALHKNDPSGGKGPRKIIIERLKFNEAQIVSYDEFIRWHRKNIKEQDEQIRELKKELYSDLQTNANTKDSLINLITQHQIEIEKIHLQHFMDIQSVCNTEQLVYFDSLKQEFASLFGRKKP
jgi:periplasmic protein CpxP/Spy